MEDREAVWRSYVNAYDIEVPQERIQSELEYITLEMRHRMQYDRLTGGDMHLFAGRELEEQREELEAAALFEAKAPLVLKELIAQQHFSASREELEAEARRIAQSEGSTIEMVKRFFGEDLALLERDVLERKAIDWACEQMR